MADDFYKLLRPQKPDHYNFSIEPWRVIHDWNLGFFDGNAVKYICRSGRKIGKGNKRSDDLRKALENLFEEYQKQLSLEKEISDGE